MADLPPHIPPEPLTPDLRANLSMTWLTGLLDRAEARAKAVAHLSTLGLRSLVILNGGAIVSLFTVIGHIDALNLSGAALSWTFGLFVIGLLFALMSTFFGYVSQGLFWQTELMEATRFFNEISFRRPLSYMSIDTAFGNRVRYAAIASALISLTSFVAGSSAALRAVQIGRNTAPASLIAPVRSPASAVGPKHAPAATK